MPGKGHRIGNRGNEKILTEKLIKDPALPIKSLCCLAYPETLNSTIVETHGLLSGCTGQGSSHNTNVRTKKN